MPLSVPMVRWTLVAFAAVCIESGARSRVFSNRNSDSGFLYDQKLKYKNLTKRSFQHPPTQNIHLSKFRKFIIFPIERTFRLSWSEHCFNQISNYWVKSNLKSYIFWKLLINQSLTYGKQSTDIKLKSSLGDPWHFGPAPDPDPTPDPIPFFFLDFKDTKKFFFTFFLITCPQVHHLQSKKFN